MPGTQPPRTFEEWQRRVERQLAESRRGPTQLLTEITERVDVIEKDVRRTPTNPVEIQYQTSFYTAYTQNSGLNVAFTAVRLLVDFPDVTKATDGSDITVDRYELWGYDATPAVFDITTSAVPGKAYPGMTVPGLVKTDINVSKAETVAKDNFRLMATSATSSIRAEDFTPGRTYKFRVRAMTLGEIQPGRFSPEFTVVMGKDTTPPPQPTAPVVRAERGQLVVTWDGQAVSGAMPADFLYAVLSQGSETSPTREVARFGRGENIYIAAGVPYYDTQFFRVQAYDEAGNKSAWSEQAFGYTEPLVDTDVILSELDAAKTHLINVDAGVSILPDTIITKHLRITEEMAATMGSFMNLKAGNIDVNSLWADSAFIGLADVKLIRGDMFVGRAFEGGTFTLTQGGKFQTNPFDNRGVKVTEAGIQAWNPVGTQTVDIQSATGDAVITGTFWTDLTGSRVRIGDRENIAAVDLWADDTINHGALYTFYSTVSVAYATQVSHFNSSSSTSPASFLQIWDGAWRLNIGDHGTNTQYMQQNTLGTMIQDPRGYFQINNNDVLITAFGTGSGASDPFIRLTEDQRRIILSTAATSGDANNYGLLQVVPQAVFMRQNNGNYADLTATYWTAQVVNGSSGTSAQAMIAQNSFELRMQKGSRFVMYTNGNWSIGNGVNVDSSGRGRIEGGLDELVFYPTGSGTSSWNYLWLRHNVTAQITGGLNVYGGLSVLSGTKNFVMPHPTKPGMELVHAATESPYSGIEYWDSGTLNQDGYWIVELPEYFEPIAAKDHRLVQVFSPSGAALTWTEIMDGQFMIEGPAGAPFGWTVKARREGYDVEVERWVDDRRNAGELRAPEPVAGQVDAEPVEAKAPHKIERRDLEGVGKPATDGDDRGNRLERSDSNSGKATSLRDYQLRRAGGRS